MKQHTAFADALDAAEHLDPDAQLELVAVINRRMAERGRERIAATVSQARRELAAARPSDETARATAASPPEPPARLPPAVSPRVAAVMPPTSTRRFRASSANSMSRLSHSRARFVVGARWPRCAGLRTDRMAYGLAALLTEWPTDVRCRTPTRWVNGEFVVGDFGGLGC